MNSLKLGSVLAHRRECGSIWLDEADDLSTRNIFSASFKFSGRPAMGEKTFEEESRISLSSGYARELLLDEMGDQTPKAMIPGADTSTEPVQNDPMTGTGPSQPGRETGPEERRNDSSESSKRKREPSEESHRTARSDSYQNTTVGITQSYYDPPLNMSSLDGVGMEVDSAVSRI